MATIALDKVGVKSNDDERSAYAIANGRKVSELSKYVAKDAYRTMFERPAPVYYEVVTDAEGNLLPPRKLTGEEVDNLRPAADGKVHVALNGIFNNLGAANKYANQHSNVGTQGPQYFIHYPQPEFAGNDLVISGYMKLADGGVMPLTNSTKTARDIMWRYGDTGLRIDAHSRGTMTAYNAVSALPSNSGLLRNTELRFYGPAANVVDADAALASRQGVNVFGMRNGLPISYQTHKDDFVGTLIGGNPATGGTTPAGSSRLQQYKNIFGGKYTPHNCYGKPDANCNVLWRDTPNTIPKFGMVPGGG